MDFDSIFTYFSHLLGAPSKMRINDQGLALIKSFEGCRLQAYKDIVGVWTIGYGFTEGVFPGEEISQEEADIRLLDTLDKFEQGVTNMVTVPINDNQFSALVCFSYNVGLGNLQSSHLLIAVNQGNFAEAANQFLRWDKAGGKEVEGLLRRREAERQLFTS